MLALRTARVLVVRALLVSITSATSLSFTLHAAEDVQLLTITGNLIDVLPSQPAEIRPTELIDQYYAELNPQAQNEIAELRDSLVALIPDYNIAFAAADTAEVNSVLSEVAYRWAVLRTFHAEHYTQEACAELERAYGEAYRLFNSSN